MGLAINWSISCHNGSRVLAPIEPEVYAALDHVDPLIDGGISNAAAAAKVAELIRERHVLGAEVVEIVFNEGCRPIGEGVFGTDSRRPSEPGLLAPEVEGQERATSGR